MGLFDEQVHRLPDRYPWTQEFITTFWRTFWTPDEFNFSSDKSQFLTSLNDQERQLITRTLSAIGQIEITVKRFWADLGRNFKHPSISDLGLVMANSEVIHNQAYEKLLKVLDLQDEFEKNLDEPVVRSRVDYLRKYSSKIYDDDRKQYVYAIILFTLFVENVSLFSQFYTIMHFNTFRNVLKDTAQQVSYTRNEEDLHAKIGIKLINTLREEYPELFDEELAERIRQEAIVAFDAEAELIEWMLGDYKVDGLSKPILRNFVASRLNSSLESIGFAPIAITNDDMMKQTEWFDVELYGNNSTDFFHSKPVDYAKNGKTYNSEDVF